ncbi:MAG: hypothetical protein B7Z66_15670 [Chromatiales bacterium 21-64-14]|nr:MAG: hypothetical protein B7Z66_15670 [Chromatiales bacterium 21-64-14]
MSYFDDGAPTSEGFKLRIKFRPDIGEVRDAPALGFVVAVRFVRAMVLWIVLYFVDRAYQESYVQRVLVDGGGDGDGDGGGGQQGQPPPRLWTLPLMALSLEVAILAMLSAVLFMLNARFKSPSNAFVIDGKLLRRLLLDYAATTAVILLLGSAFASVAQDDTLFRYREDGLRGIRAYSTMFLLVAFAVLGLSPSA